MKTSITRPAIFGQRRTIVSSVPQIQLLKTKKTITDLVLKEKPSSSSIGVKSVVLFRLAKNYIQFFKAGMGNIWTNYRDLNKRVYGQNWYLVVNGLAANDLATGDTKDQKLYLKSSKLPEAVEELATVVTCLKNSGSLDLSREQIKLSRADFQTMLRTRKDFPKLPLFAFLFALLEEFCLPLYFIFPRLMPSTCVFPAFMKTYYGKSMKAQEKLQELRQGRTYEEIALQNPYTMPQEELKLLCQLLGLGTPFSSVDTHRDLLSRKYRELVVDTHLLIRDGGVDKLDRLELFSTCVDRGLVDWKQVVDQLGHNEKSLYDLLNEDKLRARLSLHIERFGSPGYNVGVLGAYM
ncbi:hypothetical protein OGAPHI_001924 [Ogataea philodendri]|uniref:Letm1 RBD domain-containing protein n=1 Tax=Ogataea philodendri TaxID=1378263 RepID=A0A9P8PAU2_9ASCO|nr:uncharacterized protein OGAPHI_001924 [Ogataea philodendri]KAH3668170.1 hypothetical protein OGAPHI_001924 [Ogataea philodendri]